MLQFLMKTLLSALIIATVSEVAKRFTLLAALVASLPLTSLLAIVWLYHDTKDIQKVIALSSSIFWAVLPSLLFFLVLPFLLKAGIRFNIAIVVSAAVMFSGYAVYVILLGKFGIKI